MPMSNVMLPRADAPGGVARSPRGARGALKQENGPMQQQPGQQQTGKDGDAANKAATKTLSLVKGNQQFCFRYQVGEEAKVLESLIDMVNRRELPFDWFDAAVLSHQLGQHLAKELKAYLPKKAA
jgi:hypothetical protein